MKAKSIALILAVATASIILSSCGESQQKGAFNGVDPDAQQLFVGDSIAIANTQYGKVRGYILRNVYTYLGIPYGAPTGGENRFMPPREPESWEGVRSALYYGDVSPQPMANRYANSEASFRDHWNYTDASEDCLKLNVWTPGLDGKKRPVLVWCHGGGYTSGNGIEQDGYNGENIVRYGDIVFVSVNHRLGPVGYTDFSACDPKFADSGVVGMLDLVAALKWVNRNISNFGGDPSNVTVMGQSGGGAKICTLMAMPETGNLISKGVGLSGNAVSAASRTFTADMGRRIYEKAGRDMKKLQEMPWEEYIAFADEVVNEYNRSQGIGRRMGGNFGPVGDGYHIPSGKFFDGKDLPSSKMPLLLCTTTSEFSPSLMNPELENVDRQGAIAYLKERLGRDDAEELFDAFIKVLPDSRPIDAIGLILGYKDGLLKTARQKCTQDAPVYVAMFGMNSPLFDNRMKAPHCSDICYWFLNTDLMLTHTGGGARPRNLSIKMADALLSYMRTGNPNTKGLPTWKPYTPATPFTMFLGDECKGYEDLDSEAMAILMRNNQ